MTPEELDAIAGAIIDRYQAHYSINLTLHQARLVHRFEVEENIFLNDNFPSDREKHDYEIEALSKILHLDQFEQYKAASLKNLRRAEEDKLEEDKAQIHQVRYHQEIFNFLNKEIHPSFFRNEMLLFSLTTSEYHSKVAYLKAEYSRFLNLAHKRSLINHFRYHGNLQPNTLEVLRLRNKIRHLEPDWGYFYHQMDTQTKAIADLLLSKLDYLASLNQNFYSNIQRKIYEFHVDLNARHFSGPSKFSHSRYQPAEEKSVSSWTPTLLLIDKNKYGLDSKW
ncbi:hypothetical protein [Pedobacter sp. SYSU D00535]|uniref:hypothetical protein n=1 Tax=Pedobacter sp. SYSU D00535 TaxID=2810308 RepID=UPI001A971C3F|nr:hypothetical protein [Pedobacter sp. SYSU D00535]